MLPILTILTSPILKSTLVLIESLLLNDNPSLLLPLQPNFFKE